MRCYDLILQDIKELDQTPAELMRKLHPIFFERAADESLETSTDSQKRAS